MRLQLLEGQLVSVSEYGGERLLRRVVADKGRTVVICTDEEYQNALKEGRSAQGIAFPRVDIDTTGG